MRKYSIDFLDFVGGAAPGTNRDELLAIVGSDAAGAHVGLFGFDSQRGCAFRFESETAGSAFELNINATADTTSGIACTGDAPARSLVKLQSRRVDQLTWTTADAVIVRTGPRSLGEGPAVEGSWQIGAPELIPYAMAACGTTTWISGSGDF